MDNNNYLVKYTMTYGLYLGMAFSLVVFIIHLAGRIHVPGDGIGIVNAMILSFSMLFFGKKYRDSLPAGNFLYRNALGFTFLLGIFSAFIYAFFSYWYYAAIEPNGMSYFIEQMRLMYSQQKNLTEDQVNALVSMYQSVISPGFMAFLVFFSQSFISLLMGLLLAVFIRTPQQFDKENY